MFKNILVPVDGGELSKMAVEKACEFAKSCGARLTFYYAKPSHLPDYISGEVNYGVVADDVAFINSIKKQARTILSNAGQIAAFAGIDYDTLSTDFNSPHEGIIAAADNKECDLIFMASHGRRGASALLLGSETQKVLTHCKIPVLVYR